MILSNWLSALTTGLVTVQSCQRFRKRRSRPKLVRKGNCPVEALEDRTLLAAPNPFELGSLLAANGGDGWAQQPDEAIGGDTFEVFTQNAATLKIQEGVLPVVVDLPAGGGVFDVVMDGADLVVQRRGAEEVFRQSHSTIPGLIVQGTSDAEWIDLRTLTAADATQIGGVTVNAAGANDSLIGSDGDDVLNGGDGDDRIHAMQGNDSVDAGTGNDYLYGYGGDDTLDGGQGNDSLLGSDGKDLLNGNLGDDTLDGGSGNDYLFGSGGDDSLIGGTSNDYADGQGGSYDVLSGGAGDDVIKGGVGVADRLIERGDVNFILTDSQLTGPGTDRLQGFEFAYLVGGPSDNSFDVSRFHGRTTLLGSSGNDFFNGSLHRDFVDAGSGDDSVYGSADPDTLYGGAGNDQLYGQGSNDVLRGGTGNDWMKGGSGTDNLSGWTGSNTLFGQSGTDIVVEVTLTGNLTLTDTSLNRTSPALESDVLNAIEQARLIGGSGSNLLDASVFSGPVWLFGMDGDDTLLGASGDSWLDGGVGNDQLTSGTGNDTLIGGSGDDHLNAGSGNNGLSGLGGNDTLFSSDGSDTLLGGDGNDLLVAGHGSDTLLGEGGDDTVRAADGTADLLAGGGNGHAASASDTTYSDFSLDTINDAFTLFPSWADGLP